MRRLVIALAAALFFVLITSPAVFAQPAVNWHTIDGGGGQCADGPFLVTGTIGQADAGRLEGGAFALVGGFWHAQTAPAGNTSLQMYLPLVARAP